MSILLDEIGVEQHRARRAVALSEQVLAVQI
jgi:hypothetical protein